MKKNLTSFLCAAFCAVSVFATVSAQEKSAQTATFEELELSAGSFYCGKLPGYANLGVSQIKSGDFIFYNFADTSGSDWEGVHYVTYYWNGFGYANLTDTRYDTLPTADYDRNSFVNPAGGGAGDSKIYGVGYGSGYSPASVKLAAEPQVLQGAYFVNDVLAIDRIIRGDNFGNQPFKKGDYFTVVATGYLNGQKTGETNIVLADYRFDKEEDFYFVEDWKWFDLSVLGKVDSITFYTKSTQVNQYGETFPQFFCVDNFNSADPDKSEGTVANELAVNTPVVKVYPVPARNEITVATDQTGYRADIFNLSGRCVMSAGMLNGNCTLGVSGLQSGLYLLRVTAADGSAVIRRIVIAR